MKHTIDDDQSISKENQSSEDSNLLNLVYSHPQPTVHNLKDVPVKTDAKSLAYNVSFKRGLK